MRLTIRNCNNIENGEFDITEGRLNIKYAINGTGKSTISKAIEAFTTNNQKKKDSLLPFKYYGTEENLPELTGYDKFKKIAVFNEKYIEDYVYQQNELIKNSFEIFVKSTDYDNHIKEIEKFLNLHGRSFNSDLGVLEDSCIFGKYPVRYKDLRRWIDIGLSYKTINELMGFKPQIAEDKNKKKKEENLEISEIIV